MFVIERKKAVCWMDPTQEMTIDDLKNGFDQRSDDSLGARRSSVGAKKSNGTYAAFFDGRVYFLSEKTDLELLQKWATCNGGEPIDPPTLAPGR